MKLARCQFYTRCQFHARCPFQKTIKIIPLLSNAKSEAFGGALRGGLSQPWLRSEK
ncbi:MAG: hypothetical protein F6J94_11485 [Moorea sp. SIO1F2]|uniref:hypothetical protein n=1 Tax=unclassified Moorena TaxID=2683338 RepID=UPI0013BD9EEC|nr:MULTISPECIES: hypothetical protein [unclassified Moorena]NEQ59262.1 hypothetical protein [Moorena sp. SIO4A1]NET82528.1 hypothetical protein [Moorena sp. SIO1F2]